MAKRISVSLSVRRSFVLISIAVFALLIRLALVFYFEGFNSPPDGEAQPDQLDYESFAYQVSIGNGYSLPTGQATALRPPGTSLALVPAYVVFGRSYAAGRVWFCFLSALTCLAVFWASAKLFDVRAGMIAAFWLAVTPSHFYYSLHFVSELPYALAITATVGFALTALDADRNRGHLFAGLAGITLGLSTMIRPQALLIVPIMWGMILLAHRRIGREAFRQAIVATLCFTLVVGGWMVRNWLKLGEPVISTVAGPTFWGAHNELILEDPQRAGSWIPLSELQKLGYSVPKDEVQRDRVSWQKGKRFALDHWKDLPYLEWKKLEKLSEVFLDTSNASARLAFALSWLVTAPLACLGLFVAYRKSAQKALVCALPLVAMVGTSLLFYGSMRFRHSTEPLLVAFAACGVVYLLDLMKRPKHACS